MSNKSVMSHDPLAGMDDEVIGEMPIPPADHPSGGQAGAQGGADVLVVPESLTIAEVGDFHMRMKDWVAAGHSVAIDGGAVETIDGAGLQLLAAFIKDCVSQSGQVSWVGVSDVLSRSAAQMGIKVALKLDQPSGAS